MVAFIRTEEGKQLAKIIYSYNLPLASNVTDVTPLQIEFLKWSHPDAPKKIASSWSEFGKKLPELGGILRNEP